MEKHTIIAVSIPLSVLSSLAIRSALGQTINIMTLAGLALAVGILADDATVTIENVERHLTAGENLEDGIGTKTMQMQMVETIAGKATLFPARWCRQ